MSLPHADSQHIQQKTAGKRSVKKNELTTVSAEPNQKNKRAVKKSDPVKGKKITFQLKFHTLFGQDLFITGNHPLLGDNDPSKALPLRYFNEEYWSITVDFKDGIVNDGVIVYQYILRNTDGTLSFDWGNDKQLVFHTIKAKEIHVTDAWNFAGYFENAFYTEPFTKVLLAKAYTPVKVTAPRTITHHLKVKAPLLKKGETVCLLGSSQLLGNWNTEKPLLLARKEGEDFFQIQLNLTKESFPIAYKYGIYNLDQQKFVRYEDGNNRVLYDGVVKDKLNIIHDGFVVLPNNTWKGAGVAIPVFSLRTEHGLGVGEFNDLKYMVDWAVKTGLKMIQILPINDTTATHSWTDSYPYAAISAFALHPLYMHLDTLVKDDRKLQKQIAVEKTKLNALDVVDYQEVIQFKTKLISKIYEVQGDVVLSSPDFKQYFNDNKHWLQSYAVFCYLRDQYGTVDFNQWPAFRHYDESEIEKLAAANSAAYKEIALHYFIQYQLHLQLKEATTYAHSKGIIVKGDIAIGVYRHGADAWQHPELYHMDAQAGAPPDDFAVAGQNWGFPTYNWERMQADGFSWWKQRFEQMSYYFDAFRIDHILGFFRIWSIPMHAVEGILGRFVPAIPVHINEFQSRGISFDHHRFTQPFIHENVLWELFGYDNELVKKEFLQTDGYGQYTLKPEFATQRQVEQYFHTLEKDEQHEKVKKGLYNLISNVLLFEDSEGDLQHFHFRFNMESTSSFRYLDQHTQQQLKDLYVDYFFRRQDDFWMKEAMKKLPALKRVTNMLVCGEDLGFVPACVPDGMRQLGLLSLEIQRMPKDPKRSFFHPADAPYLSVVTPSTHDMSTIRGWWEEDKERIQQFYNHELGQLGEAPYYCEAWINTAILIQHLYSPSMWTVFQLQDLMGMDAALRKEDPHSERINIPADPKHYWRYRMHLTLESLLQQDDFNATLHGYIQQ
ncbi:MAG: 4-alpha-glucanotransferase, partial [Chitinophagaceae bacterium]|nr:4-alpha-glucanotransferase [Chitinophagaceae bacterium]